MNRQVMVGVFLSGCSIFKPALRNSSTFTFNIRTYNNIHNTHATSCLSSTVESYFSSENFAQSLLVLFYNGNQYETTACTGTNCGLSTVYKFSL